MSQFVNRKESSIFHRQLEDIRGGKLPEDRYFIFVGEKGIGKTQLLAGLATECAERGISHALIHALTGDSGTPKDTSDLLMDAAQQMGVSTLTLNSTETPMAVFANAVSRFSSQKPTTPVALLIDDFDRLPKETRNQLQREVFAPLTDEAVGNVVIAAAATDFFNIPRFDLRRRLREIPLEPFTEEETASQLGDERLGLEVHAATYGLPLANNLAAEGKTTLEIVSALLPDKDDPNQPDAAAVSVSPFRGFGYALLRAATASLQEIQPDDIRSNEITAMTEDLENRGLIHWKPGLPLGFSLYPTARRVAAHHLKTTQPATAQKLHSLGREYYQRLSEKDPRPGLAESLFRRS